MFTDSTLSENILKVSVSVIRHKISFGMPNCGSRLSHLRRTLLLTNKNCKDENHINFCFFSGEKVEFV